MFWGVLARDGGVAAVVHEVVVVGVFVSTVTGACSRSGRASGVAPPLGDAYGFHERWWMRSERVAARSEVLSCHWHSCFARLDRATAVGSGESEPEYALASAPPRYLAVPRLGSQPMTTAAAAAAAGSAALGTAPTAAALGAARPWGGVARKRSKSMPPPVGSTRSVAHACVHAWSGARTWLGARALCSEARAWSVAPVEDAAAAVVRATAAAARFRIPSIRSNSSPLIDANGENEWCEWPTRGVNVWIPVGAWCEWPTRLDGSEA